MRKDAKPNRRDACRSFLTTGLAAALWPRGLNAGADLRTYALTAGVQRLDFAAGSAQLAAFNARVPGPVLEAQPGDSIRLNFTNLLTESTNLHFHGLHVPSTGVADNSFLEVRPGASMTYEFDIPRNHPGGTFWYHPHHHGLAAKQLSQGLAGAFLIRGILDEIPEIAGAPQQILVLQDFGLTTSGLPVEPSRMERLNGREGGLVTVNGQRAPSLFIEQGGWLRLRIINASASRFYRLQLEDHVLNQIASDGGALPTVQPRDEILLTPGERVEVMVRGSRDPGRYRLRNLPYDRGSMMMGLSGGTGMGMGTGTGGGAATATPPATATVLANLAYQGVAESNWDLPERITTVERLPAPRTLRTFRLGEGMSMRFTINGSPFDARRVNAFVKLNTVEDWEFNNPTDMDHPMHIHTNSFQVLGADGQPIPAWKDVVLVRSGERVRVRIRFEDFTGPSLFHCHILDHEDLGMMGRFDIGV